jgi:hypothetical protein
MKTIVKGAIRDQKGQVLILTLILLVVGGLILTPLLGLMSTGLLAGQVYEKKMSELYAADAGVEDAIWRIMYESIPPESWKTGDRPDWQMYKYLQPLSVGDKRVYVAVYRKDWDPTCGENLTYQILSTAVTHDDGGTAAIGSSTTIESYVDAEILVRSFLDNAITSLSNVEIGSGSTVYGNVQYGVEIKGETEGINSTKEVYKKWPSPDALSNLYLGQVDPNKPCDNSIDLAGGTKPIGPCYINGSLTVDNTAEGQGILALNGTVYVTVNAEFAQSGDKKAYTVKLNGNTMFALGEIKFPTARVTVEGPGCIIAIGNINFQPSISSSCDFVLLMSVDGRVDFKPSGTFYGSVAGDEMVNLQPKCGLGWLPWQGLNLNFPTKDYAYPTDFVETVAIRTWEINPQ